MVKLNVKFEYFEILKLNFILAYKYQGFGFVTIVGFVNLYPVIDYLTGNNFEYDSFPAIQLFIGLGIIIVIPLSIIFSTKNVLKNNKFISQRITYNFDPITIKLFGETFDMTFLWSDLYKIKFLKNWILLYTSKTSAYFIPINRFENDTSINEFKEYVAKFYLQKRSKKK
jgi:hypothetical protein